MWLDRSTRPRLPSRDAMAPSRPRRSRTWSRTSEAVARWPRRTMARMSSAKASTFSRSRSRLSRPASRSMPSTVRCSAIHSMTLPERPRDGRRTASARSAGRRRRRWPAGARPGPSARRCAASHAGPATRSHGDPGQVQGDLHGREGGVDPGEHGDVVGGHARGQAVLDHARRWWPRWRRRTRTTRSVAAAGRPGAASMTLATRRRLWVSSVRPRRRPRAGTGS